MVIKHMSNLTDWTASTIKVKVNGSYNYQEIMITVGTVVLN